MKRVFLHGPAASGKLTIARDIAPIPEPRLVLDTMAMTPPEPAGSIIDASGLVATGTSRLRGTES